MDVEVTEIHPPIAGLSRRGRANRSRGDPLLVCPADPSTGLLHRCHRRICVFLPEYGRFRSLSAGQERLGEFRFNYGFAPGYSRGR